MARTFINDEDVTPPRTDNDATTDTTRALPDTHINAHAQSHTHIRTHPQPELFTQWYVAKTTHASVPYCRAP